MTRPVSSEWNFTTEEAKLYGILNIELGNAQDSIPLEVKETYDIDISHVSIAQLEVQLKEAKSWGTTSFKMFRDRSEKSCIRFIKTRPTTVDEDKLIVSMKIKYRQYRVITKLYSIL